MFGANLQTGQLFWWESCQREAGPQIASSRPALALSGTMKAVALVALCCVAAAHAKVYFEEKFDGEPGPLREALTARSCFKSAKLLGSPGLFVDRRDQAATRISLSRTLTHQY